MLEQGFLIMNKKNIVAFTAISALLVGGLSYLFAHTNKTNVVEAYPKSSLTKVIDLNDSTELEIRNYYNGLSSLSNSERQGNNLLIHLKEILKDGQKYYKYDGDGIWAMYEITDRDWAKSPASEIPSYNSDTNIIEDYTYGSSKTDRGMNPYVRMLYADREYENQLHAWSNDEGATTSHGDNKYWCIDQEHIWPKSQGFEASGQGGARGDPMHLWPGDSDVNSSVHNNNLYGYVNITPETKHGKWDYGHDNYVGTSLTLGTGDDVFEPQDSDKGDIARAIFYLVARYNYLSGEDEDGIDSNNPNLELVQDNTVRASYTSNTEITGKMGIMTDLLAWHHADPVDEFEIHRNNLLYKNYTNNRNPFIDFPEWVDYIWGTAIYNGRNYQGYDNTPTGYADPATDTVNGYNEGEVVHVSGVTLNRDSATIVKGNSLTLTATVSPSDATNKVVFWSSDNTSVASVSNSGVITANNYGSATITATTMDGGFTDTCEVEVVPSSITATVNKTYYVGDIITKSDISVTTDDSTLVTDFNFANNNYQFKYEDASSGGALTNKTFTNAITFGDKSCSLTVQVQRKQHKTTMSDTLDNAYTGSPSGNSYKEWTNAAPNSDAVYKGKNAGSNGSVQLTNTVSTASGIVTTTSGGQVSTVEVAWYSDPANGRSLKVYGKNTAYSSPSDLFDSSLQGTLLGTITASTTSINVSSEYLYVGVCANGGAIYLSTLTITYVAKQTASNVSNYIMFEDTNGQCTSKTDVAIGYYDEMSDSEKEAFNTSDDYVISKGRERFTAWLKNQGKEIDNTTYEINKVNVFDSNYGNFDSNSSIIFILIASISSITLLSILIIKKRKLHN